MKKFLTFTFIMFVFALPVKAASLCSYQEQSDLNAKAANVKVSYEVVEEKMNFDDSNEMLSVRDIFEISVLNITDELYVVIKNDLTSEEKTLRYSDTTNGIAKYRWNNTDEITNFTIQVYTTSKTKCPNERYKTIYLTTPRFNEFHNLEICQELSEFYLCQKYVTFAETTEDVFLDKLESYRSGQIDDQGEVVENSSFLNKVLNFISDNKWYILVGLVLVAAAGFTVYKTNNKKRGI